MFEELHRCFIAPDKCPNANVSFHLYTRQLESRPYRLDAGNPASISNAPFVDGRPFILLLHGYTGHKDFSPNIEIRPGSHWSTL